MKPARKFAHVSRRFYRPEQYHCPDCQRRLRRAVTLSERTVITLEEVIKLVHAGYRCPEPQCVGHQRTYRSVKADALALPWFTYGLDIVLLVGQLRLREHQTVDEIHQELLKRLEKLRVKIARREVLYLFEAYCTLLRASSEAKDDQEWLGQVEKNGGIIVSVDGIQPEKGNETIYLVRDALTGRVLAAENVTSSETAVMKALLAPVVALEVKVLGTITDAQESELKAVEELWPEVPHQVCQFHALRDAAQPAFEADKKVKTAMRKHLQPKVRAVRKQLKQHLSQASPEEAKQLAVLDDYAAGIVTALNTDGVQPFTYAAVEAAQALDDVEASLQRLPKRGNRERAGGPEIGAPGDDRGRAGRLERATGAAQAHAPVGAGCRAHPRWQLGARGRGGEQRHGGQSPGWVARAAGAAADRGDPFRVGAGVPHRVLTGTLQPAAATGAVLRPRVVPAYQ